MEYYSAIKKNEILPCATTCMSLEGIMLREISQTKTNTIWFPYMWNLKNKINEQTKQKQMHRYKEQTDGSQVGRVLRSLGEKDEGIKKYKLAVTK